MAGGRVEVISSKGCSRLFVGSSGSVSSVSTTRSVDMMSSASVPLSESTAPLLGGPFAGLVICVTGLSKEARKQVMAATERLGGQYSANLHPQCTHLVVQSSSGRKFDHALKHGFKTGLSVVTLGWFVESVRRNVRLNESLYSIKSVGENSLPLTEFNQLGGLPGNEKSCLPVTVFGDGNFSDRTWQLRQKLPDKKIKSGGSIFSNEYIYIDPEISSGMKEKVVEAANVEGATILDQWLVGCHATHVVCEGPSVHKYIGLTNNLVTPPWILKTVKEKCLQRLVHLSSDLARQVRMILESAQIAEEDNYRQKPITVNSGKSLAQAKNKERLEDRQKVVDSAKVGVRIRRSHRMQSCEVPILPITPSSLLESICWSISEPTSSARIYAESSSSEDASEKRSSDVVDVTDAARDSEALGDGFSRALRESERREVILKGHFLTILFPMDRFGEIGPSSRTFFSDGGFTCQHILDYIYNFYQEYMSTDEIEIAIHTDSRHADRLRSLYASKESIDQGFVSLKRIDFVGSRRSFEALKRINGGSNSSVYELIIRA